MKLYSLLSIAVVLCFLSQAQAGVISSQLGNTDVGIGPYAGQGVVTGIGGPWQDISFHFDSESGAGTTPFALGELFILDQNYFGTPAGLSAATAGFVASTSNVSGGKWVFDSSVTLEANTLYYFIMGDRVDEEFVSLYGRLDGAEPGVKFSFGADQPYLGNNNDLDYVLEGRQVPEPTTAAVFGMIGLAAAFRRRRR